MKLNLGCGEQVLEGHINVDKYHPAADVRADLKHLPFRDSSADEILCSHVLEHIPFPDEEAVWTELLRVNGGTLNVDTPDLEWLCEMFTAGKDEFTSFYQEPIHHFFGHGLDTSYRWGVIAEFIFGNQRHPGEFHCNGYTLKKFAEIARMFGVRCEVQHQRFTVMSMDQSMEMRHLHAEFYA